MTQLIIGTAQTVRQIVLQQVQAVPEQLFDIQPAGYNNTIRWNVGHIIHWMDVYLKLGFSQPSVLPPSFATLFGSGTAPANWTETPPSKEELVRLLSAQLQTLSELAPEGLDAAMTAPLQLGPLTFTRAGELLNFGLVHEGMHLATCGCIIKAIQSGQ